ncbi:MAG: hypothetical protein ABIG73_02330 [Patescibacteria group bacterium]
MIKRFLEKIFNKKQSDKTVIESESRLELEKKVVKGAEKAVKEYKKVFERIAEFDKN